MPEFQPQSMEDQLSLSVQQVDLMLAIDAACDSAADDIEAMTVSVSLILQALEAEVGLLSWFDPDTERLEIRSLIDRAGLLTPASQAVLQQLSQTACVLPSIQPLSVAESAGSLSRLYWLGAPLRVKDQALGALLLANVERPFNEDELTRLAVGMAMLDSALLHLHTVQECASSARNCARCTRSIASATQACPSTRCWTPCCGNCAPPYPLKPVSLCCTTSPGINYELRAATNHDLLHMADQYQLVQEAASAAVQHGTPAVRFQEAGPIHSLICLPLILNERIIGVLGVINRAGRIEFTRVDRRLLIPA